MRFTLRNKSKLIKAFGEDYYKLFNPGKDVMDVITPEWKEYINHKIKHLC